MKLATIRLLVVDDHEIVRLGVKHLLSDHPEMDVAGEAACGEEALKLVHQSKWGLVLLDISMPTITGIDTLKLLKESRPDIPVLILSMYPASTYGVNAMRLGADGYLCKDCLATELVSAIHKIASGHKYLSTQLTDLMVGLHYGESKTLKEVHTELTGQEFQVFCKFANGQSVSKIADDLFLTSRTVNAYRTRILLKMGMKTNAEMTYYAIKHGLIQ